MLLLSKKFVKGSVLLKAIKGSEERNNVGLTYYVVEIYKEKIKENVYLYLTKNEAIKKFYSTCEEIEEVLLNAYEKYVNNIKPHTPIIK